MENTTQTDQRLALAYTIAKKLVKYTVYLGILYFAYKGFMAWD
jgi:hypothetical protein